MVAAMERPRHQSSGSAGDEPGSKARIAEIGEILAIGLSRLEARKSSRKPAEFGESSLHFTPDQSGDDHSALLRLTHD
jgi:hypothetical protein